MIWFIFSIFRLVTAQQQMKSESEASFSSLEVCCCWSFFRIFEAISEFPLAWDHAVSLSSLYMSLTPCALLKKKKRKTSDRRLSFPKSLLSAKPLVWKVFFFWCKWNSLSQERFRTQPRFESESFWNSEMAYTTIQFSSVQFIHTCIQYLHCM